ncbi:MAG TPA: glycosyltransferase family 9 protein, partial [Bacteroidales bacterium]|nr:glycosyltransferase family 9 protein [Bacteroidales bacterium]
MKKILVIQTASIGDVILATPVIEKLHRFFGDAEIDLLVKKGNESLFKNHTFLHSVLIWDKTAKKKRNLFRLLSAIRSNRYDTVINLQRFALTGLLTAFSGARNRIGFSKNPFSFFFSMSIPHLIREGMHETDRNLELIRAFTDDSTQKPRLYPTATDLARTVVFKSGTYYTISPASLWFTKQYPTEKWVEFITHIDEKSSVFLLGSGMDVSLCEEIIKKSGHAKTDNLAGKLTFLESAALMKDAKMNYTNDSAPMHLASSVNAPVTAIYCSTIPGFGFGPLSDDQAIVEIKEKLYCRPCGLHGFKTCPEGHFKCAWEI